MKVIVLLACLSANCTSAEILAGRVVEDHSGNPLPSSRLRVFQLGSAALSADLETGADGQFRATGLSEGNYRIDVSRDNYVPATLTVRLPASPLMLRLMRKAAVAGLVMDGEGRPVPGAAVFPMAVDPAGHIQGDLLLGSAKTNAGGRYRVHSLPPGRYALAVSWAGLGSQSLSGASLYPSNSAPQLITLSGGDERLGIDFPAAGTLALSSLDEWGAELSQSVGVVPNSASVVEGLAPGRYRLTASKLGEGCFAAADSIIDTRSTPEPATVLVTTAGQLRGRLSTGSTQHEGAIIVLMKWDHGSVEGPVYVAFADARSEFVFPNLRPGRYRIAARSLMGDAGTPWIPDLGGMFEIEVKGGGLLALDLPVSPTGVIP